TVEGPTPARRRAPRRRVAVFRLAIVLIGPGARESATTRARNVSMLRLAAVDLIGSRRPRERHHARWLPRVWVLRSGDSGPPTRELPPDPTLNPACPRS